MHPSQVLKESGADSPKSGRFPLLLILIAECRSVDPNNISRRHLSKPFSLRNYAIGRGNSDLFAKMVHLNYFEEPTLAEFILRNSTV